MLNKILSESSKHWATVAQDSSTDRSNLTMNLNKNTCSKIPSYKNLKTGFSLTKDFGGYNTLLEYLDKPIRQFVPNGKIIYDHILDTSVNAPSHRSDNIRSEVEFSKLKLKSCTPVTQFEKKFLAR